MSIGKEKFSYKVNIFVDNWLSTDTIRISTTLEVKYMAKKSDWIALSYNVPINPSKNRVYIWRKLKECGAEYFKQGVAILPNSTMSFERFKVLASKVRLMNGEATIIELNFVDDNDTASMIEKFRNHTRDEYEELIDDFKKVVNKLDKSEVLKNDIDSQVKQIEKKFSKTKSRQFFPEELAKEFEADFNDIKASLKASATDFSNQIKSFLDNK
ncbi:MAG: hypothetical protein RR710_09355 [Oscillospiraceae bacterium]